MLLSPFLKIFVNSLCGYLCDLISYLEGNASFDKSYFAESVDKIFYNVVVRLLMLHKSGNHA